MISSLIFFLVSTFFGYRLVQIFSISLSPSESVVAGLLLGSSLNIIFNFLIANLIIFSPQTIILSQALLVFLGILLSKKEAAKTPENAKLRLPLILIALISLAVFTPLFITHMLLIRDGNYYSGGFTYGDLAFHTTLINMYTSGNTLFSANPIFSGSRLTYPPAMDFLSAMLIMTGATLQQALSIPGVIYATTITSTSFMFAYQITRKISVACLTPILLVFNGGIGFIYFILDAQKTNKNIMTALSTMSLEYAHLGDHNIRFSNIVCDYFLPQRPFLFGFSAGILILILVFKYFDNNKRGNLIIAGALTGLLPLIHPHSLMAMGITIPVLLLIHISTLHLKNFLKYFLPVFALLAIIPVYWILSSKNVSSDFLRIQFFWMSKGDNPLWFYFKNLGLVFPVTLISLFLISKKLIFFYIPFVLIFVLANTFIFQPHDYDNMKIMLYWFLASVILVAWFLVLLWERRTLFTRLLFCVLLFLLIFTGLLSVLRESYSQYQMYDQEGVDFAKQVRDLTSPGDIILTSDQHNHPVTSFSGRRIVMGYRGWLWTWGYNYHQREKDIGDIYKGLPNTKNIIKKYNIAFVVIGPSERDQFQANETYFDQNFRLLLQTTHYKIYDTKLKDIKRQSAWPRRSAQ